MTNLVELLTHCPICEQTLTVRNRLDAIVESLADTHTHDVLTDIQNKKIDADEGIEQIRTWKEEK